MKLATMKKTFAWACLAAFLSTFVACGGGGGSSSSASTTSNTSSNTTSSSTSNSTTTTGTVSPANPSAQPVTATAANAVPIQVSYAPSPFNEVNDPMVSVTICTAGSNAASNCTTINNVLVDTESFGLRLFASAVPNLSSLPAQTQSGTGATVAECALFGSGFSWGTVRNVDIKVGGEIAQNVPVQMIADTSNLAAPAPSACEQQPEMYQPSDLGANGILGIGVRTADCGSGCASGAPAGWYYACSGILCTAISQPVSQQVSNPVTYFPNDNNGVIVELPPVGSSGSVSANGMLLFGIDTQSNNALAGTGATILGTNESGDFNATYNGTTYANLGFFDSGSTFMYFQDASVGVNSGDYYAPSTTLARSVVIAGTNSTTATVNFNIGDATTLLHSGNYGFNNVGHDTPGAFDMGLPFFFGRHLYYGIEGAEANGVAGPFVAFTSS